jgi:hypothetical protein
MKPRVVRCARLDQPDNLGRSPAGLWTTGRTDDLRGGELDGLARSSQSSSVAHSPALATRPPFRIDLDLIQNEDVRRHNVAMMVLCMDQFDLSMNAIDRSPRSGHTGAFHPEQAAPPLAQHDE